MALMTLPHIIIIFDYIEFLQGISGFMDFIHRPVFEGTQHFGNWMCFRPQVKGGGPN
jgi:hypothetical protein